MAPSSPAPAYSLPNTPAHSATTRSPAVTAAATAPAPSPAHSSPAPAYSSPRPNYSTHTPAYASPTSSYAYPSPAPAYSAPLIAPYNGPDSGTRWGYGPSKPLMEPENCTEPGAEYAMLPELPRWKKALALAMVPAGGTAAIALIVTLWWLIDRRSTK